MLQPIVLPRQGKNSSNSQGALSTCAAWMRTGTFQETSWTTYFTKSPSLRVTLCWNIVKTNQKNVEGVPRIRWVLNKDKKWHIAFQNQAKTNTLQVLGWAYDKATTDLCQAQNKWTTIRQKILLLWFLLAVLFFGIRLLSICLWCLGKAAELTPSWTGVWLFHLIKSKLHREIWKFISICKGPIATCER